MKSLLIALAAFALFAESAQAAVPTDLVKVALLADVSSIKAGQPFTVGVKLTIKPDWHVYWKNPGDSGMATKVNWKLPPGFVVGSLQFPFPIRFDQPGDVIGYGYKNEVLLTATVTPPNDLSPGTAVDLSADVSWMVCERVCIPGKATVSMNLPAGDAAAGKDTELFAKWRAELPTLAAEKSNDVSDVGVKQTDGAFAVFCIWQKPPTDVQWFPVPPETSGVEKSQTKTTESGSVFTFELSPPPKGSAEMEFLVVYKEQNGMRQGVEFRVNLPPPAK